MNLMKLFDTLTPISAFVGALLLSFALGAGQAVAQDDVTVSIESQEAQSGQSVDVPVQVSNFNDVGSISLTINYDAGALSFPEGADTEDLISGTPRDGFTANVSEPGVLKISWFDGTGENPINLGSGTLLSLNFGNFSGGTGTIGFGGESEITNIQAETIPASYQDGIVADELSTLSAGTTEGIGLNQTVAVPLSGESLEDVGSVSLRVEYDEAVAQFEGLANNNSGLSLSANASNGVITIGGIDEDAQGETLGSDFVELEFTFLGGSTDLSFSSDSEVTSSSNDPLPVGFQEGELAGDEPTVSITDRGLTSGSTVTIPVRTSELQEVGSASIDVTYNPAVLTFDDFSNALSNFNLSVNSPESGIVRIGGLDEQAEGVNPSDNNNRFVDLQFTVATGLSSESETTVGFDSETSEVTNPSGALYNTTFNGGVLTVDPEPVEFDVATSRNFGDASDPSNYELVALPGAIDQPIEGTLSGQQGTGWRVFRELGASGDSGEANLQEFDGSDAFNFRPGRAFWVTSKNEWSFEGTVSAVQEGDGTPSIALQEGWNAISNPLQTDLDWSAIEAANGDVTLEIYRWKDGDWIAVGEEANDPDGSTDTLRSATEGIGYYVLNDAELDSLDLTTTSGTPAVASAAQASGEESSPQTVQLTASPASGDHRSSVTVGLDEGADEATTYRAPPAHFGSTALRIAGNESDVTYMRMVTPSSESESAEFDLTLQGEPGSSVTLEAEDLPTAAGTDLGVMLVEESSGTTHDLRSGSATVSVPEDGEGTVQLQALLGAADQLRKQTAPEKLTLEPNYPNPFTEQTTIEYAVPEQTDVTVQVYNVLGQKVATLEQDTKAAGSHRVKWDGSSVSSGTYFVRIEANGSASTQQVTVVK